MQRCGDNVRGVYLGGQRAQCGRLCSNIRVTPHTSHLTPHTSHLTPHTSHLTPDTSHLTYEYNPWASAAHHNSPPG